MLKLLIIKSTDFSEQPTLISSNYSNNIYMVNVINRLVAEEPVK